MDLRGQVFLKALEVKQIEFPPLKSKGARKGLK